MISSALGPSILVSVITKITGQCHSTKSITVFLNVGFITPLQFQIKIFMIGLEAKRESKHVGGGPSLVSLEIHTCLNSFLSLITLGNRFTTCFRIPNCAWLLRIFSVHAMVGIENWRSFSTERFPITIISIGCSRSIFLCDITSSR